MSEPLLSRFTPSLMSAEALEAIFVQREGLAQRLMNLIRESAQEGAGQQNTLVVGPRGIGKTHLVSLLYHRLKNEEDLKEKLLIAWLREDEWGISSFLDLLLRILSSLRAEYGDSRLEDLETFFDLSVEDAERKAGDRLVHYVGKRSLLVIAENLDEIFSGMGSSGQRRLRAFLQEHGFVSILATSQSLFNGVALQTSPFYGFFRVQHLAELDHREAVQLLTRIAELTGKSDLVAALKTPEGRARVRAVHHLAGGNPRIYIIFSQFLTRDSLDDLVGPMIALLDDLTPYYQARMAWLSPQQRKIVEFLCDYRGAVTVKEIAKKCFASQQSVSGQLKSLRDAGYALSLPRGRESYYEIREPLMRLCMEMKKHRGEPVRLLVDFLRLWYSPRELRTRISESVSQGSSVSVREALLQALSLSSSNADPRIIACLKDFARAAEELDPGRVAEISDEMLAVIGFKSGEPIGGNNLEKTVLQLAFLGKAGQHAFREDLDEMLSALEAALAIDQTSAFVWSSLALARSARGEWREALDASEKAVELGHVSSDIFRAISTSSQKLGFGEQAASAAEKALALDPGNFDNLLRAGEAMCHIGCFEDGLRHLDQALSLKPGNEDASLFRFVAFVGLGRVEEAIESIEAVIKIPREIWMSDSLLRSRVSEFCYGGRVRKYELAELVASWVLKREVGRGSLAWKKNAVAYVKAFHGTNQLPVWSVGLVRSALLFRGNSNHEAVEAWLAAWKEAGAGEPELEVPLKLLEGAIRFLDTNDERVLLGLSQEERRVVEALLSEPTGESANDAAG